MERLELTNEQRKYFGLDPIQKEWDRVIFAGDKYRPESLLYFEGNAIKRHIVSTENEYSESQYNELTVDRKILLPKTGKGKEKKLSASVLQNRGASGVYLSIKSGHVRIGNFNTQTTFYDSHWHTRDQSQNPSQLIAHYIESSSVNHLTEIEEFKKAKRKNINYKSGDYFCFKLDRTNYGFGRILLDVTKAKKNGLISSSHGLTLLMGTALIVELFAYISPVKNVSIAELDKQSRLPSDTMMDNHIFYGEYEIIGNRTIDDLEFTFPISYGTSFASKPSVFLQWGLIHKEICPDSIPKYLSDGSNPYGYYSNGFSSSYDFDISQTVQNNGVFDFSKSHTYRAKNDLRNPDNEEIRKDILNMFGLDPNANYIQNCILTGTILASELIKKLS